MGTDETVTSSSTAASAPPMTLDAMIEFVNSLPDRPRTQVWKGTGTCDALFAKLGFETVGVDIVPILVEANCRFIRAVTHPSTVRVTIRVTGVGPKIVETTHDIFVGDELYATGECKLLWMSRSANKGVALPDEVRARLLPKP